MDKHAAHSRLVLDFLASWSKGFDSMVAGFRSALAPDCLLQQTKTPDLHGLAEIEPFLEQVRSVGVMETIDVEVRNLIVTDHYVVSERVDYLKSKNGKVMATIPCVGVMEIVGNKIKVWRDYFDSGDMPSTTMSFLEKL